MNIPNSVRIVGTDYDVIKEKRLNNGDKLCYGRIDHDDDTLKLNPDYGIQQQEQTFLHEVVHGICYHFHMDSLNDDEKSVDMLATGFYAFIKDNPEVFK